jgi:4-nitrophenyl phosphatase
MRSGTLIPGAREGVEALRAAGLDVVFLTNNPIREPAAWAHSLTERGIDAEPEDVITSMDATLAYLRRHHAGATVLPVAGEEIVDQVRDAGFGTTDDRAAADVVVAGYHEAFDYDDLLVGLRAVRDGVPLVGTDPDRWVPTDEGPIPGSGAVINAVSGAAEIEPEAVLGKPSAETAEIALDRLGVPAERTLMVGDRLDTDVALGRRAGTQTALVLTGASEAPAPDADYQPDHVLDSLGEIGRLLG